MSGSRNETHQTEIRVSDEEARHVASLLRYAVSLNTTAGLVSPTERRLASPTYKAAELAALVLEGKPFEEAVEEANEAWTGSLEDDHRRALELLERNREFLRQAMTGRMTPEQLSGFLEVTQNEFLDLTRSGMKRTAKRDEPASG